MQTQTITIINKLGLHARAATKLVHLSSQFLAETKLIKDNKTVNAKSIMGIMMLAAAKGTTITITCEGEDEIEAMKSITSLIQSRFGENE